MKRVFYYLYISFAFLLLATAFSCNEKKKEVKEPEISAEEMKVRGEEMMKSIVPGEEHKQFGQLEGNWNFKCTMQGGKGKTEIFAGAGRAANKLILGGRFLQSEFNKTDSLPLPIGLFILGFDRVQKKYTTTIFSEGGTNYVTTAGSKGKETNMIHTSGSNTNEILKVQEDYDVDVQFMTKDNYRVVISFKDKMAKATMSSLTVDLNRSAGVNPQPGNISQ